MIGAWERIRSIRGSSSFPSGNSGPFDNDIELKISRKRNQKYFRFPFELNTAIRCAYAALMQSTGILCSAFVGYSICSFFTELTIYSASCLRDIRVMLAHVDSMSHMKMSEQMMLDRYIEVLNLHDRLNR